MMQRLRVLAFTCSLLLPLAAAAQSAPYDAVPPADGPYHRVRYEPSGEDGTLQFPVQYTVWIPDGVRTLRGVVVHQHGCGTGSCRSGLTGAYDLHWQALAAKHDCALLAAVYEQPEGANCRLWCDPREGSDEAFRRGLRDLGEATGHPELATVPWALWGHSGGGYWCGGMTLLHPDRVVAAWLRSGVPSLQTPQRDGETAFPLPGDGFEVPILCNLGTKEGVTDTSNKFAKVWPGVKRFHTQLRGIGAPIGIAIDPNTSHECGDQRYLAIPYLDECLAMRLPEAPSEPLRSIGPERRVLEPSRLRADDDLPKSWLPSARIAELRRQYVIEEQVHDATPPPAPSDVELKDGVLTWDADADLESGLRLFEILRDGEPIATVPEQPTNPRGRKLFQGLQYSDTPTQPLQRMRFEGPDGVGTLSVRAVNTVGQASEATAARE